MLIMRPQSARSHQRFYLVPLVQQNIPLETTGSVSGSFEFEKSEPAKSEKSCCGVFDASFLLQVEGLDCRGPTRG